jgi:BlaI family transcriptional regulator, penicillinase repressor
MRGFFCFMLILLIGKKLFLFYLIDFQLLITTTPKIIWNIRNYSYHCFMKISKNQNTQSEPTKSELEILQVLWEFGPSTARFVNDHLNKEKRQVIYMSTLKLMQIMVEKALLKKDASQMTHIYEAAIEEGKTKGYLLDRVVDNIFNGSAGDLMMQLLGNKKMSEKEMEEFKELIRKLDQKD